MEAGRPGLRLGRRLLAVAMMVLSGLALQSLATVHPYLEVERRRRRGKSREAWEKVRTSVGGERADNGKGAGGV